jgi:hypothetical protein
MESTSPFRRRSGQQVQPATQHPLVGSKQGVEVGVSAQGISRDSLLAIEMARALTEIDRATHTLRIAREHFDRLKELASR